MSRYKRYERYKDSGVEWIGEIPEHWIHCKLGYLLVKNDSGTWGDDYDDDGVVVLRSTEITLNGTWSIVDPARRMIPVKEYERCLLREGDLILTKSSGSEQHIGKTVIVDEDIAKMKCVFSNFMQRLRPENGKLLPKYLYYFLNVNGREQLFYLSTTTTGLKNISGSTINALKIQLPTMYEQVIIANFLDQKTTEIDDLIADKEKLIELLQEKRQAIITEAVTKGLNPSVKMKDSGVEWIGEIPEHWEIGRLKNSIKSCRNGIWGDEPQGDNNDIACIRVTDFNRTNMEIEVNDLTIRNIPASKQKLYLLKYGDLLIEKSGGGEKQPVGFVTIFKHNIPAVYANFIARIELDKRKAYSGFFKYIYSAMYSIRLNVRSIKQTTGIQNLDTNYYFDERVMYPPLNEQIHIANFLDQKTAEIDDLIFDINTQIQKLKEYRQSLISEAVTGKIDVREFQKLNCKFKN